jgi:hypothetical protein
MYRYGIGYEDWPTGFCGRGKRPVFSVHCQPAIVISVMEVPRAADGPAHWLSISEDTILPNGMQPTLAPHASVPRTDVGFSMGNIVAAAVWQRRVSFFLACFPVSAVLVVTNLTELVEVRDTRGQQILGLTKFVLVT